MPIYTPSGFLDITNATLRTSNIESQNINFTSSGGSISVGPAFDFQQVSAIGNTTPETIQFTNATTSFVTSGNVEVGKNISVVDATVSSNMSVGGNVTVSSNLSVSGNVTVGKNLFLTSNTTTSINSNVIVEHSGPHPREPTTPVLKKFPEIDFDASKMDGNDTANTYVQAGYVVTASSQSSGSEVWRLFDDGDWNQEAVVKYPSPTFQYNPTSNPNSLGGVSGEWFKVKFPRKVIINKFTLNVGDSINNGLVAFKVLGSDDDTNWTEVKDVSGLTSASYTTAAPFVTTVDSVSSVAYRYYAVVITRLLGVNQVSIREVEFYGYEEDLPAGDTSLDTTFTSILNRPQTGGVKVYVDGDTLDNKVNGPTPTGTDATYDSAGKYWTLTGALTSNVTLEANTFLEGDAPHSVSMWFNSSNLEANVSNTCVFSVSDQEKLDSVNLDLQSNTWHNLTYAYQGEGGSRVTYLDGRKVSEDQAEDTFGDYPPFAMTGYSQGGYVVSASSMFGTTQHPYLVFDNNTNPDDPYRWVCEDTKYNTDGSYAGTESHTDVDGNVEEGEWLKIEIPHKLKVSYFEIAPYPTNGSQSWRNYAILGSNDDSTWYQVQKVSGLSNANGLTAGSVVPTGTYKNSAFKYFVFIWGNKAADANRHVAMGELKLYGHRENDLVRLPDPTHVLKYPHIEMTGPAQRGYVFTGSSQHSSTGQIYSMGIDNGYLFDGDSTTVWHIETNGTDNHRYDGTDYSYGTDSVTNFDPAGINIPGEWVQLEFPHKLQISKVHIRARSGYETQAPEDFTFYGSDTAASGSWTLIQSFTGQAPQDDGTSYYDITSNPAHYKYILMLITRVVGTTALSIAELQYFGTEEASSVPIQIGGGNIDKVANFRVYDTFVGEDQALEIWDAQKDTFRGVKNSMTLHKGRLGIGTTEPEGRLAILDEPHNLEEFPPRAMTDYKTYFEGHGEFCASASDEYTATPRLTWKAFNKSSENIDDGWMHSVAGYTGASSGTATGTTPTYNGTESLGGIGGDWISLEFPYKVKINRLKITSYHVGGSFRGLNDGFLLGRGDKNSDWTRVHEITNLYAVYGVRDADQLSAEISFTNDGYYNEYALIATSTTGETLWTAMELKYFGTREQRQSVLHDGQLTLTKNLDVPRIGPPLDADDTPRRDRLVVEYNTSTNPTFEGAVRDTSGRENDGMLLESARYDASDKAFVFDGAGGPIERRDFREFKGNQPFTASMWFKKYDDHWGTLLSIAPTSGEATKECIVLTVSVASSGRSIDYQFFSSDYRYNPTVNLGSWHHVAFTYSGGTVGSNHLNDRGGRDLYFDGVLITPASETVNTGDVLNLPNNPVLRIGERVNSANHFDGSISNFKLYDCALTASEVKTLYDMGRNGSVANPQPLHIAAPLYAPGSIVQVQYASTPFNNTVRQTITGGELSDAANDIDYLEMNFKPKFANSSILLTAMINSSETHVASFGFKEDGTVVRTQANNSNATGAISTVYEGTNNEQHIKNNYIQVLIPANGTHTRRYNAAANSYWGDVDYTLHINDRLSNDMRSISNMIVYEIAN